MIIHRHPFLFFLLPFAAVCAGEPFDETQVRTLFAFDSVSIPHTQNLRLEMRQPERHPANPVLRRGAPGTPDAYGVQFYGSVIREAGKYRMWYVAFDDDESNKMASARWRPAYAESVDAVNWTKPDLGLVTFKGNKHNNLILTDPTPLGLVNLKVLLDPDDPDPKRRYKATGHAYFRHNTRLGSLAPFVSADGLSWEMTTSGKTKGAELVKEDLVLPAVHFEPSGGLYKWEGLFYASGQNSMNAPQPYHGRVTRMYRSADFVSWSQTSAIGFVRVPQHTLLGAGRSREGEQTHEGISVWNRGNVLIGVSGLWHGAKEWKDVTIDLGFMISNDGLKFREAAHEWAFIKRGEDGAWDQGGLLQGQGFENIGDQTFIYYGAWDPRHWEDVPTRGGVGIAVLPRDRFGDLVVEEVGKGPGDYQMPEIRSEFVTASIPVRSGSSPQFYVNADGLGEGAFLRIELLDALEKPLAGYSGLEAAEVRRSGFQTPVEWGGGLDGKGLPESVKLRVFFEGARNTAIRLSAIYVQP
jgi:hypothetical protein